MAPIVRGHAEDVEEQRDTHENDGGFGIQRRGRHLQHVEQVMSVADYLKHNIDLKVYIEKFYAEDKLSSVVF